MPARAYLALGSNLGDRAGHLRAAVAALRAAGEQKAVSSLYETNPVGLEGEASPQAFLNAVLAISTTLPPDSLLSRCLEIEAARGRRRAGGAGWASRTLDLDLLAYNDLQLSSDRLTLPHPRLTGRPFVLIPLAEIAPDLLVRGIPVRQWAERAGSSGVRLIEPPGWATETGS